MPKGFNGGQEYHYRPLVRRAWLAHCAREGISPACDGAHEDWYRKNLVDAIGKYSTSKANQTDDFDYAMLRFATIANDTYWMERATSSAERRVKWCINEKMQSLTLLEQRAVDWNYVVGIFDHMRLAPEMDDCPAELLRKVLQALDTHIRRLRKKKMETYKAA